MNKRKFERLTEKARKLSQECMDFRIKQNVRYGQGNINYWTASVRTKYEKLRERSDKAESALFKAIEEVSPRNWSTGIPVNWIVENITWEMATTKDAIEVPPVAWGGHQEQNEKFAMAIE